MEPSTQRPTTRYLYLILATVLLVLLFVVCMAIWGAPPDRDSRPTLADWFVVGLTVVLGGVGAVQAYIYFEQARLMAKQKDVMEKALGLSAKGLDAADAGTKAAAQSAKAAQDSAAAAEKSLDATLLLERPIVVLMAKSRPGSPRPPQNPLGMRMDEPADITFDLTLNNLGRSLAWIVAFRAEVYVAPPAIPDGLTAPNPVREESPNPLPITANTTRDGYKVDVTVSPADRRDLRARKKVLFLVGEVEYRDVFNNNWKHGFGWKYVAGKDPADQGEKPLAQKNYELWIEVWTLAEGPSSYNFNDRIQPKADALLDEAQLL